MRLLKRTLKMRPFSLSEASIQPRTDRLKSAEICQFLPKSGDAPGLTSIPPGEAYADAQLTVEDIDFFALYDCFPVCFLRALEAVQLRRQMNDNEEYMSKISAIFRTSFANLIDMSTNGFTFWNLSRNSDKISSKSCRKTEKLN